jgi:hypothetical protein
VKKYVLEWSKKQESFHIQPLEHLLAKNQLCFIEKTSHDYIVLMVGEKEVCFEMADHWRDRLVSQKL